MQISELDNTTSSVNAVHANVAMEGNAKNPDSPVGRFSRLAACTIRAVNEQLVKHWKADNFQMCGWHLKMKDITMDYGLWTIDIYRLHMITYFV